MCYRMNTINWPKLTCNIPVTNQICVCHKLYLYIQSHVTYLCACQKSYVVFLSQIIHYGSVICHTFIIFMFVQVCTSIFRSNILHFSEDGCHLILLICDLQFPYISYFSKHCFQMRIWKQPFVEYFTRDSTSLPSDTYYLDSYLRNVLHRKVLNFENVIL